MSYPIYKLLRAVNRQYPNNGFIHDVDVREEMTNGIIEEDLRDLINETIQEIYKDVAIDEVWSFPTVPGQNQYSLPEDCDLRDIQEVTRTFVGSRLPLKPPPGPGPEPTIQYEVLFKVDVNEGNMGTLPGGNVITEFGKSVDIGEQIGNVFSESEIQVFPNEGYSFTGWSIDGTTVIPLEDIFNTIVTEDITYIGVFKNEEEEEMRKLTDDLTLTNGVAPELEEGFYYTGNHKVFVSGGTLPLFGQYSTFYYDVETKTLTGPFTSATYDTDSEEWLLARDEMLATEVANNDRIPVNSAVNYNDGVATATAFLETDFTSTSETSEAIPLESMAGYVGPDNRLSFSGNDIVIGPGISAVLISASIDYEVDQSNKGMVRYFSIRQTGSQNTDLAIISKATTLGSSPTSEAYQINFTPFIAYVEQGDHISLGTLCASGTSRKILGNYNTWLTVQEIKVPTTRENPL